MIIHKHLIIINEEDLDKYKEIINSLADCLGYYDIELNWKSVGIGLICFYFELPDKDRDIILKHIPLLSWQRQNNMLYFK